MRSELIEILRDGQRLGFFGSRPIEQAVEHSLGFVDAIGAQPASTRMIDLGSGGGLPGLVLAETYPDCDVVLVDRRQKRTDFLNRAIKRLGYQHTTVRCTDVAAVVRAVACGLEPEFDIVTARGFGPPEHTLRSARRLVRTAGLIVISEPPAGDRWNPVLLSELGVVGEAVGSVRRFTVSPD